MAKSDAGTAHQDIEDETMARKLSNLSRTELLELVGRARKTYENVVEKNADMTDSDREWLRGICCVVTILSVTFRG